MENVKGYGAILGDMIAVPYELKPIRSREFEFFNKDCHWSDDTIMTIATMDAILNDIPYAIAYKYWGNKYFGDYYGGMFKKWLKAETFEANDSYGNGAAMRVSPIGYAYNWPNCSVQAYNSVVASHQNEEAKAFAVEYADVIRKLHIKEYGKYYIYNNILMNQKHILNCSNLKAFGKFKVSCKDTVPVALRCYYECDSYENIIRTTVSLGGDCDTIASMACELKVAETNYMEKELYEYVEGNITTDMLKVLKEFNKKYTNNNNR